MNEIQHCNIFLLPTASRYHVEPPGLIKLENEIELEEEAPPPPPSPESSVQRLPPSPPVSPAPSPSPTPTKVAPSKRSTGKLLDDAVSRDSRDSRGSASRFSSLHSLTHSLTETSLMCAFVFLFQVRQIADDPPCRCPNKFCVERQSQGRYRVGEKMLFIRVSRVMCVIERMCLWKDTAVEISRQMYICD